MRARLMSCALALAASSGCSYVFVIGPPDPPDPPAPGAAVACTEGRTAPVIDTMLLASNAISMGLNASRANSVDGDEEYPNAKSYLIGSMIGVALYGSSALYGYKKTGACRELRSQGTSSGPSRPGCRADIECKGDRICAGGLCREP